MQNINDLVIKNFNDNISYIEKNHPLLFSKLTALDSAIENGFYHEKYELVYENDCFDVLELSTKKYLYDNNSTLHAELATKSVDYTLDDNLFESFYKHDISDEELAQYEKEKDFDHHMSGYASILHYIQKHSSEETVLKKINKYIFFGTGLGLHIEAIDRKIKSKVYFIIEDDLELFRLSLFTTNYKLLSSTSKIIFSIFEDEQEFTDSSKKFLDEFSYYNHYIKYFQMLNCSNDKRNLFHIAITNQPHLLFFYNSLLTQYMKPLRYISDNYKFLDKSIDLSKSKISEKPFLLLAAGPSLQKNTKWLKENYKKFITIAITSILPFLEKEEITPDIITHLDAFDNANMHFDNPKSLDFLKNSICIFSARLPIEIMNRFTKEQLFLFENGTQYLNRSLKPSAPCVGSITYQILLLIKAKNIYVLGLDQTIDNKTGKTHSDSQEYLTVLETNENAFNGSEMKFKESLFYVEGNYGDKQLTTPHFKAAIDTINASTNKLKQSKQNIYNLSSGAKFNDTISKKCSEVNIIEQNIEYSLLDIFNENSFYSSSENFIYSFKNKLSYAKDLKGYINKFLNHDFINESEFIENLELLSNKFTQQNELKNHEIARVIDTYLNYVITYIFNFFNTQKSSTKDYNKIKGLLSNQLLKIIEYYCDKISTNIPKGQ